jgi:hypothetical protein
VARVFEAGIAAHPEDWHMLQRVFTADLDLARLAAAEATAQAADGAAETADGAAASADGAEETAAAPGHVDSGAGRAARNGQVNGAALDGLSGGAGAGEGGSEP